METAKVRSGGAWILSVGVWAVVSMTFAEKPGFDRYQPIIDRQMFGRLPEGFDPTKPPSTLSPEERKLREQQQEQLRSAIRLSAINIRPSGTVAVGFTDSGDPAKPVHYYLGVGETRDGWLIKSADPIEAKAVIAKGEVEITLELGQDSAKQKDATKRASEAGDTIATTGADGKVAKDGESADRPRNMKGMRERRRRQQKEDKEAELQRQQESERRLSEISEMKEELAYIRERVQIESELRQTKEELQQSSEAPKHEENDAPAAGAEAASETEENQVESGAEE